MPFRIIIGHFLALFLLFSCAKNVEKKDYTLKGGVFGTTYKITYLDGEKNYQKEIDSLFKVVNNSVSTYIPNSDISRINRGEEGVKVDAIFTEVLEKSKRIYKETNGFFDPTVGNLVNVYGFGPEKQQAEITKEVIAEELKYVGLEKVNINNKIVIKDHPRVYLDFNSIAKGFGIDVIARFLESKNLGSFMVEIGGEIRAKGLKKNGKSWIIQLVNPVDVNTGYTTINLSGKSMATSGNYRKFKVTDAGEKYVHTINPKTGLATESNLLSASVIAPLDCADVDAYATAFMAMGLEKTKDFLKDYKNIEVILLFSDKEGNLNEYSTNTHN
ncbi:FAD:protein FMN transferase [Polaribacter dokdonensis]|uniref:FAD:protein FMN transferase n=1 Tax=Polaribacter dokdonensis DSW-5 TaxID=1300348 RepID=A0A0M9CGU2_9FLAO|nr:FAD:protein FMN transferase [Polaribacter dokdonensis]KOY51879.1 ApbE family protein [Polaribacter dokdonensis DSW-5]SEE00873.1 thiamine biosynthesis lipoprotein [Polaribacter dokdonensis DSW-5]